MSIHARALRSRLLSLLAVVLPAAASALAADAPWAIPDAPFRAVIRAGKDAPSGPEYGYGIELPELGHTMPTMADVVLTDTKGQLLPLAKVWRGEGQKALLLAQQLSAGQEYYVYFGGNRPRRQIAWTPKVSLVLETRRLPAGTRLDEPKALEAAWKSSADVDGAGFVPSIAHGENPFGDSANFLSRYTGWLRTDDKALTLYTLSSDASFVFVSDRYAFGWPGQHGPRANEKNVARKEVDTAAGATRIDYYHAKAGESEPVMVLGWVKDGKAETIPAAAWMHPGGTEVVRVEQAQGWPAPLVDVRIRGYIGWNGLWLYETQCGVHGGLPDGWTAAWEYDDGGVAEGAQSERVLPGPVAHSVRVRLTRGKDEVRGVRRIAFAGPTPEVKTEDASARNRYLDLLERENPALLSAATLKADFQFVNEFGSDQLIGKFGSAWIAKNPDINDPLWISGQLARLRSLAQSNPQQALAEVRKLDSAARKKYAKEVGLAEIELLVFYLKDPTAVQAGNRFAFENPNTDAARLAKIRIGDLYRLLNRPKDAEAQYRSVQKTIADETQGRKFAAQDRSNSITITDLVENGDRHEAEQKVNEWELEHPMAKFDSDLLLVRGRVLMLFGRWNEALQEIDSFRQMQPDSPYQIPADFHRARALFELGRKDEARQIWQDLATKYPKHELAPESQRLAKRP